MIRIVELSYPVAIVIVGTFFGLAAIIWSISKLHPRYPSNRRGPKENIDWRYGWQALNNPYLKVTPRERGIVRVAFILMTLLLSIASITIIIVAKYRMN